MSTPETTMCLQCGSSEVVRYAVISQREWGHFDEDGRFVITREKEDGASYGYECAACFTTVTPSA